LVNRLLDDWLNWSLIDRLLNDWSWSRPVDRLSERLSDWYNVEGIVSTQTTSSGTKLLDRCISTDRLPGGTARELVTAGSLLDWSLVDWDLVDRLVDRLDWLDWSRVEI